jgi:hypothetical protein
LHEQFRGLAAESPVFCEAKKAPRKRNCTLQCVRRSQLFPEENIPVRAILLLMKESQWTYTEWQGQITIKGCSGCGTALIVPSRIDNYPVTHIGWDAFRGSAGLTEVTLPHGLLAIEGRAFEDGPALGSINIPASVNKIERFAFSGCAALASIKIPAHVEQIGYGAFFGCENLQWAEADPANPFFADREGALFTKSLDTLFVYPAGKKGHYSIPASVTAISDGAFSRCAGLTGVEIPPGVHAIPSRCFMGCGSLAAIGLPPELRHIGNSAFAGCSALSGFSLPPSVRTIGREAFKDCLGLLSISIPGGVTALEYGVFSGCENLTRVRLPADLQGIPDYAFAGCRSLSSICLPPGADRICEGAFQNCAGLKSFTIPRGVHYAVYEKRITPAFEEDCAYAQVSGWKKITKPGIAPLLFAGCAGLKEITIPASVRSIGDNVFDES